MQCRQCPRWYHGVCVQLTAETAEIMNQQGLEWICRRCYLALLVDTNGWQRAVEVAVQTKDFSHYDIIFRKGERLKPHSPDVQQDTICIH